ncbi:GTP 3',8-cyclase MoaA [Gilvimarinus xylanilyticus]|uniref:GTP 3',8-cyclase n=1 Tax=Gilvimarinus xylanilyticus TaxID=2944139 RepID=A0A9X2KUZ8_9GAMM|nr:GTP 3',8-cyclase MoaA [Gilvimarinus xylanilyticus]MCP8900388.1 GTP 3',8-cyclase MoaA [Gilvimarinus xylanilyticus]
MASPHALVDQFGRTVSYLRMSVTDRCDLRCVYCMAEDMTFLPRHEVLSHEEMLRLAGAFTRLGVTKLRLTGGEPLVRQGIVDLVARMSQLPGLQELCMTTNGTRLEQFADDLKTAGLDRINVSLDTLDEEKFRALTRFGKVEKVLAGIRAAQRAGFKRIKINCVALKNRNASEVVALVDYALNEGLDISFIEEMPLGKIDSHGRAAEFISSDELREMIGERFALLPSSANSGGPARYWISPGYESRIGFISPHSQNFCASCNRVRMTATGRLLLCLGQEHSADLRAVLRDNPGDDAILERAIIDAMALKPKEHTFDLDADEPQIVRFMNTTGG